MRVAIADDAVLFREGCARLLEHAGMEVVGQASDADELVSLTKAVSPDVVITDVRMPPTHTTEGLDAARRIRSEHPDVGVLVLSQYVETHQADELLGTGSGRVGYLLKDRVADVGEFVDSVRARQRDLASTWQGTEAGTEQLRTALREYRKLGQRVQQLDLGEKTGG